MKCRARVRISGPYDPYLYLNPGGMIGWHRTPRPHPYDAEEKSWWIYWIPQCTYDEFKRWEGNHKIGFRILFSSEMDR